MLNRASPHALIITVPSTRVPKTVPGTHKDLAIPPIPEDLSTAASASWSDYFHIMPITKVGRGHRNLSLDSGHPFYCPVTRRTQGLCFVNSNNATMHGWGQGESLVLQLIDPIDMDDPFQYTKDMRVNIHIYQVQDHMTGMWYDAIREATVWDLFYYHAVQEACDGADESE
jgi:hypothetical protein